jgi:carnitine O-acetyltransferase
MSQHDLRVEAYQGYSKGMMKKFKCSPDAYVQMIIQLAYYKFYGKNRPRLSKNCQICAHI